MKISRVSMFVANLDGMGAFYAKHFGGRLGTPHLGQTATAPIMHCHVHFDGGTVLDLMYSEEMPQEPDSSFRMGIIQFSFSCGSREAVDAKTEELRAAGCHVYVEPRSTVTGRYASIVCDPESNLIELTE